MLLGMPSIVLMSKAMACVEMVGVERAKATSVAAISFFIGIPSRPKRGAIRPSMSGCIPDVDARYVTGITDFRPRASPWRNGLLFMLCSRRHWQDGVVSSPNMKGSYDDD